jgi:hypothetical protein
MGGSDKVKETDYEKELAKVYSEQWDYYESNIVPEENKIIADAKTSNDSSVYQGISDDVNLGYQKSFSEAGKTTLDSLASQGVDPSSGKGKGAVKSLSDIEGSVNADATSRSEIAGQERYIDKMGNVMAMGQGEAQDSVASLSDIAVNSQKKAISDASISANNKANINSTLGALGGAYTSHSMSTPNTLSSAEGSATYTDSNGEWMGP